VVERVAAMVVAMVVAMVWVAVETEAAKVEVVKVQV
jgi:hypothetical protein